jgi:uncharacterized protein YraI
MKKAKVIKSYKSAYPDPLIIKVGQNLKIEQKESEWPGWTWCIDDNGKAGWVPSSYLEIDGNSARAFADYNANELTAETGDELILLKEESGWYWCEDSNGSPGWVPSECVEIVD